VHVHHDSHSHDPEHFSVWTQRGDRPPFTATGTSEAAHVALAVLTRAYQPCAYCGRRATHRDHDSGDWLCEEHGAP